MSDNQDKVRRKGETTAAAAAVLTSVAGASLSIFASLRSLTAVTTIAVVAVFAAVTTLAGTRLSGSARGGSQRLLTLTLLAGAAIAAAAFTIPVVLEGTAARPPAGGTPSSSPSATTSGVKQVTLQQIEVVEGDWTQQASEVAGVLLPRALRSTVDCSVTPTRLQLRMGGAYSRLTFVAGQGQGQGVGAQEGALVLEVSQDGSTTDVVTVQPEQLLPVDVDVRGSDSVELRFTVKGCPQAPANSAVAVVNDLTLSG